MKRYSQYKDSGSKWLGRVPAHWSLVRIGTQTVLRSEKGSDKDFQPLSVTKRGVVPQLETAAKTDDGDNRKIVRKGDFVINGRSDRKGSSGVSDRDGSVSLINITMELRSGFYPRFAHHLFRSYAFQEEFYRWGKGIVADLWSTNYWDFKRIIGAMPPLDEQEVIAAYLDAELVKMDATISSQEQMIKLLKERRSAIITQAVTRGLDSNAMYKASGSVWLGQVPAHWSLVRTGSQTVLRTEKGSDKDFQPLSVTKLGVVHQLETAAKSDDGENRKIVRRGNFVINGRSDRKGSSGVSDMDGSVSVINITMELRSGLHPRFAHHLFRSYAFQEEFYRWGKGIVADLWSTNYWDFKRIMAAIPPLIEQKAIASFLDTELGKMDSAISSQERMIKLLKERRHAIITQAVTGQVDLR